MNDIKPFQVHYDKDELIIGCGKVALIISELRQEDKKRVRIEEFLRGFSFA